MTVEQELLLETLVDLIHITCQMEAMHIQTCAGALRMFRLFVMMAGRHQSHIHSVA